MKSSLMRPAFALALALSLASCGGGKAKFPISGVITGLQYSGLVLSTNGMDLPVPTGATTFTFPNELEYGDVYDVTVKNQPQHQTCGPQLGTGSNTAGRLARINVSLGCVINSYTIGGTISGLTADGLVLANGSTGGTLAPSKGTEAFKYTFANPVQYNVTYGVTIITQPTGLTCTVANSTGVMGDANIENININCVPAG